jgi:hypothetical protein
VHVCYELLNYDIIQQQVEAVVSRFASVSPDGLQAFHEIRSQESKKINKTLNYYHNVPTSKMQSNWEIASGSTV